jgi:hypothetical protein
LECENLFLISGFVFVCVVSKTLGLQYPPTYGEYSPQEIKVVEIGKCTCLSVVRCQYNNPW